MWVDVIPKRIEVAGSDGDFVIWFYDEDSDGHSDDDDVYADGSGHVVAFLTAEQAKKLRDEIDKCLSKQSTDAEGGAGRFSAATHERG